MTYIVFSFDTEDYVNPHAADGILRCAEILRSEGIRGCFNVVAKLAEALVKWGRQDVIEALKYHEIETHSYAHSWHPTINEYTDIEDFEEAKRRFLENELKARKILMDVFGVKKLYAACPPGESVSYVAHYGYAEMGIPVYCGDRLIDENRGRNIWNCNILSTHYHVYLDRYLVEHTQDEIDEAFDLAAATKSVQVLAHHPQMALISPFCDLLNFNGENVPEEQWKLSDFRPKEHTEKFYENFAYLAKKLKNDPRFEIVTYADFERMQCSEKRVLTKRMIPELRRQTEECFFPVTTPDSFCISDIFLACRDFLCGKSEHECGTVYGFLDTPYAISEPITVTAEQMRASAAGMEKVGSYFMPTEYRVGETVLGPADWLRAALAVLDGEKEITLLPDTWQIDLNQFPWLRDMNLKGTWVHSKDFEDQYLSERARLQSWTIRLEKGTPRMIF